jgi:uncharacterized protein (TIGR03067 family)
MTTPNHCVAVAGVLFLIARLSLPAQSADPGAFSLSAGDVTEAIIRGSVPAQLKVVLTPEKSTELAAFTERNLNKQGRIIVAGKVRAEPFIRERMTGPLMEIYVASADDALATVKALLTSKLKFDQLYKWSDSSGTHYSDKPPPESSERPSSGLTADPRLLRDLQGSWAVTNATMNGRPRRELLESQWKFQGNELVLTMPEKGTARFAIRFDPKSEPKALQLTAIEPANSTSGWILFARDGNKLKIAFFDNLEGRPEAFEPRGPGTKPELIVVTLQPKR